MSTGSAQTVILARNGGKSWSLSERGLLIRAGCKVSSVDGRPDRIRVEGEPRGTTFETAIGHGQFAVEREALVA